MREVVQVTEIDASPDVVWTALCDFQGYVHWNRFRAPEGRAELGAKVVLKIGLDPRKRSYIKARITQFVPGRILEMTSGTPPIVRIKEAWELEADPGGGTTLIHSATVTGFGASIIRMAKPWDGMDRIYAQMDGALARYVTKGPAAHTLKRAALGAIPTLNTLRKTQRRKPR